MEADEETRQAGVPRPSGETQRKAGTVFEQERLPFLDALLAHLRRKAAHQGN